jgi:hypothetical protein
MYHTEKPTVMAYVSPSQFNTVDQNTTRISEHLTPEPKHIGTDTHYSKSFAAVVNGIQDKG